MGTWGDGLLDSDGALDCAGEVTEWLEAQAALLVDSPATEVAAARLAALMGLLLHLSPYSFESPRSWPALRDALEQQHRAYAALSPEAATLMRQLLHGAGKELGARRGERSGEFLQALGGYLDGVLEPCLLAHEAAGALVQEVAGVCADMLDVRLTGDLDLYESADAMGAFALLLLLPPCRLEGARLKRWHGFMREARRRTGAEGTGNPDIEFFDRYMVNVELAFRLARARFV